MLKNLYLARKDKEDNSKLLNMLSYFSSLREWGTVRNILRNINHYTKDQELIRTFNNFFLLDKRATKYFGIAEDIVGSMSNMVFGGGITIDVKDEDIQKRIDDILRDGYFMQSIDNVYKAAIATKGKAYLFLELTSDFNSYTDEKVKDNFLRYTVVPEFELKINNYENTITRSIFKTIYDERNHEEKIYRFDYIYKNVNKQTALTIIGFNDNDKRLKDEDVKYFLGIDLTHIVYDFTPFGVVNVGEGMLPNIIYIENSLAKNLYYQDKDLSASQTQQYIPENFIDEIYLKTQGTKDERFNVFDDLETLRVVKTNIDGEGIKVVEGKSAIATIERNLALNVIQAALDAKINPISIGYLITDRLGNNTDAGSDKERASIRLRASQINKLKPFIAKEIIKRLNLDEPTNLTPDDVNIIFAQYITPSVESLTNTLAKQRQFGLKSGKKAVAELNGYQMFEEELEEELREIRIDGSQMDLNPVQQIKSGIDNRLKSEGLVE